MIHDLVDIHCHMLPAIDDGADSEQAALAMARLAVGDGIATVIVTPHQLGGYRRNTGDEIRRRAAEYQRLLDSQQIPLQVLPGGDVRIEGDMCPLIQRGEVLTLGDFRRHVLLELPHELYLPLEPVLVELKRLGIQGVLSHPERNAGLLRDRSLIEPLVRQGCLMQVTAGSLLGTFGSQSQQLAEWMLERGLVHFLATDAHGARQRRPRLQAALKRAATLVGEEAAIGLCRDNPRLVACGSESPSGIQPVAKPRRRWSLFAGAT